MDFAAVGQVLLILAAIPVMFLACGLVFIVLLICGLVFFLTDDMLCDGAFQRKIKQWSRDKMK